MTRIIAADRIVGMMHVTHLAWLAYHASKHKRILEVGSYRGRSTRALCDNTSGTVTAVDTWLGSPGLENEINLLKEISGDDDWLWHEFQFNLYGVPNIRIIRQESLDAANTLSSETFDMIFIDGLHDYESVKADIKAWFPMLEMGGLFCGHDFLYPDVAKAIHECFPGFPDDWEGDVWAIKKGGKGVMYQP